MGRVDLDELSVIVDRMRALGVRRLRDEELEIDLADEQPHAKAADEGDGASDAEVTWPDSNADVYKDPFSYSRGVPTLKRFDP